MAKNRIFYLCIALTCVLFYIFYPDYLSFLLLLLVPAVPLALLAPTLLAARKIAASCEVQPAAVFKGEKIQAVLSVRNTSFLPIARGRVDLVCSSSLGGMDKRERLSFPIPARDTVRISWEVSSRYCGRLTVRFQSICLYDPLGLICIRRKLEQTQQVPVLPRLLSSDIRIVNQIERISESDQFSTRKPGNDSSETFGIREYREGDSLRAVHWKLSSKLEKLLVREFSTPVDSAVALLVELNSAGGGLLSPVLADAVLEAAAALASFLAEHEKPFELGWFRAQDERFLKESVLTEHDLQAALPQLLACSPYNGAHVLRSHCFEPESPRYSQMIYLTAHLQMDSLAEYARQPHRAQTTILYAHMPNFPLNAEVENQFRTMGLRLVQFTPDSIAEDLEGLPI
jgi:uncharacterized protein (DUF58 family)